MSWRHPTMLAAMVIMTFPLAAQVPQRGDSTQAAANNRAWAEGWHAGHASAGAPSIRGRLAVGFLGGLPVGFFGPVAVTQGDGVPVIAAGAGAAAIGFALAPGRAVLPDTLAAAAAAQGATYERAYRQSHAERLSSRQRGAVLVGEAAGMATGLGLLILLISGLGT